MRATLALLAVSVLLLSGCGEDTAGTSAQPDSTATSLDPTETTDPPSTLPECKSLWKAGVRLPSGYAGCLDLSGNVVGGEGTYCESGQTIFTHGNDMYAAAGHRIVQVSSVLRRDAVYQRALKTCRG